MTTPSYVTTYMRQWRKKNETYYALYCEKNKEKLKHYGKIWRQNNREHIRKYYQEWQKNKMINAVKKIKIPNNPKVPKPLKIDIPKPLKIDIQEHPKKTTKLSKLKMKQFRIEQELNLLDMKAKLFKASLQNNNNGNTNQ